MALDTALLDFVPEPVMLMDAGGALTYCNPAVRLSLGAIDTAVGEGTAGAIGLPVELVSEWSRTALSWYPRVLRAEDGTERRALVSARPVVQAGQPSGFLVMLRLQHADNSRSTEGDVERLAYLAEISAILVSSLDFESTLVRVAEAVVPRLADWCVVNIVDDDGSVRQLAAKHADPEKQALAQQWATYFPPDPERDDVVRSVIRSGSPQLIPDVPDSVLVASASSDEHLALMRALGLRSALTVPLTARNRTLGAITLITADSERRLTEADIPFVEELGRRAGTAIENARLHREAQANAERFRNLFTNGPEPMWVYDLGTYEFLEVNDAAVEVYGYTRNEFCSMRLIDLHPPDERAKALDFLDGERPIYAQALAWRHRLRDGSVIDVEVASHVLEFDGRHAALVVARDVTARRRMEEIEHINRGLEAASRMKSEFLANMSHELRTPLNAIIGFSEVLHDERFGELNDRQRRYITNVLSSGRHLLALVNDVLDISKIEAGRMELHPEQVDMAELLREAVATVRPLAYHKSLDVTVEAEDAQFARADRSRVIQILYNLLSNAIKFTPDSGAIHARCGTRDDSIEISVRDTGIGIAPEDQERIFQEFEQIDTSHGRQQTGTGLGLTLTKHLVELHGGVIRLESAVGVGSTFTISIPRAITTVESGQPHSDVLLVEDDPASLELLQVYLSESGYSTRWTDRESDVPALVRELRPAAIILDIVLQGGEAWNLLAQLKSDPVTRAIPVVIVSILDEQERGLTLGASEYLVKPVVQHEVLDALRRVVRTASPRGTARWQVLAVDDQMEALELVELALADSPFQLMRATSGDEALELLKTARPDVMLVDLVMAPISGFDLIDAVVGDPALNTLPIIVLTAKDLTQHEREQLTHSAVAVLPKSGFSKQRFLQELERAVASGVVMQ